MNAVAKSVIHGGTGERDAEGPSMSRSLGAVSSTMIPLAALGHALYATGSTGDDGVVDDGFNRVPRPQE